MKGKKKERKGFVRHLGHLWYCLSNGGFENEEMIFVFDLKMGMGMCFPMVEKSIL